MVLNDPLAAMLSKMQNAVRVGKNEVIVKPVSKVLVAVLTVLKESGYVESFEIVEDGRGNHVIIKGFNQINKCGAIKPRFTFSHDEVIAREQDYLPAKDFGVVIVTTSKGLMTIQKAHEHKIGGKLIAYCY
ncbi:MAG: small subunit ribosomal protein S8 [Candidatus Woesearchaeota archaeon]|jgi:small subunit ribosomal protein S8